MMEKVEVVDFNEAYADKVSAIITRNLFEVLKDDYTQDKLEHLASLFTPEKIIKLSIERKKMYVALSNGEPVGTLSVVNSWSKEDDAYVFLTIFVLPEYHKMGIGRKLINAGEDYIRSISGKKVDIPSSITSHLFYNKLGYGYVNDNLEPDEQGCIPLTKRI